MIFSTPFAAQNPDGDFPAVLLVEHARSFIPPEMNGLGVAPADIETHIGWDIGIEGVTRGVSDALNAPAVYCLYSRLIIDVNRPLDNAELIRPESDGIDIPGNQHLSDEERAARIDRIFYPYHDAAEDLVTRAMKKHGRPAVIAMHSCTPQLRGGAFRPWEIGLSTYGSEDLMRALADVLKGEGFNVGLHDPYDARELPGMSLDTHGHAKGLPDLLIEIRQDQIADEAGQERWAGVMARAFRKALP
jgi:predicted N-formylglutamate amidohydrolase